MYIWLHIAISTHIFVLNTTKRCAQYFHRAFTIGSWCRLHQAKTATVYYYPTSMQRAAAPAQLPCYIVRQLKRHHYK